MTAVVITVLSHLLEENGLEDVVEMPPIGDLDVEQILGTPYLFC